MYKSRNQNGFKFVERLVKNRIMFKDILKFLGLDYRDALLVLCCPKIKSIG